MTKQICTEKFTSYFYIKLLSEILCNWSDNINLYNIKKKQSDTEWTLTWFYCPIVSRKLIQQEGIQLCGMEPQGTEVIQGFKAKCTMVHDLMALLIGWIQQVQFSSDSTIKSQTKTDYFTIRALCCWLQPVFLEKLFQFFLLESWLLAILKFLLPSKTQFCRCSLWGLTQKDYLFFYLVGTLVCIHL